MTKMEIIRLRLECWERAHADEYAAERLFKWAIQEQPELSTAAKDDEIPF